MIAVWLTMLTGCSEFELKQDTEQNYAEPDIAVSTTSLHFGLLDIGESSSQVVTVTNQGNATLTLLAAPIQNLQGGTFTLATAGFPLELPEGEALDLYVSYTAAGTDDVGLLNVVSNDPDSPDIPVTLGGGYTGPKLVIDPPAANFEEHMLNCLTEQEFTLTNVGSEPLDLYSVSMKNEDFAITQELSTLSLEPGRGTTVEVTFTPEEGRLYESILYVDSNDPDGEQQVPLYGVGNDDGACQALDLRFEVEYEIGDVAILIDNTNPRFSYLMEAAMANEFGDIVEELNESIDDITFGVAIYQDYNASPYGGNTELPFLLKAQQTANTARVLDALTDLRDGSWHSDEPASTMEALYQALTGAGYDQECDGDLHETEDVQPFRSSSSDPFGGRGGDSYSSKSGDGTLGGMGFREGALPIVIFVTDSSLRDPDSGYPSPGGCSLDAGSVAVAQAKSDLGARIVGVAVTNGHGTSANLREVQAISDIAFSWAYHSGTIKEDLINTVEELIQDVTFDEVWLEVSSDAYNQIDAVTPERWELVRSGTEVEFSLSVTSALVEEPTEDTYTATVEVHGRVGDDQWLLTNHHFYIMKPVTETETGDTGG